MSASGILDYDLRGEWVTPRYLSERDDPWLRELLTAHEDCVGMRAGDADAMLAACARRLIVAGARGRSVFAARSVLDRAYCRSARPTIKPRDVRRALYRAAADGDVFVRDAVLERVASELGIETDHILAAAFGDFPEQKEVAAPEQPVDVRGLRERTNLALLTALLHAAQDVEVTVREHVRAVVRFAKLKGLLCVFGVADDERGGATRIHVSGPLSLFGATTKYGAALAAFVPHVASTTGWRLEARCVLEGRTCRLQATAGDPIHRAHALPKAYDSTLERRLARDLRRLGSEWTVAREAGALRTASGLVFPDFALSRRGSVVHVEVVGFWTKDYLEHKQRTLSAVTAPLVVCVDAAKQIPLGAFGDKPILLFRKSIDARALLACVEDLCARATESD